MPTGSLTRAKYMRPSVRSNSRGDMVGVATGCLAVASLNARRLRIRAAGVRVV